MMVTLVCHMSMYMRPGLQPQMYSFFFFLLIVRGIEPRTEYMLSMLAIKSACHVTRVLFHDDFGLPYI
jgi:hypothetical protein